jgi:UDP-N-acetylmuramoyl-L-alanyl-D-glutamate--2,6-diaminopimelate ligase
VISLRVKDLLDVIDPVELTGRVDLEFEIKGITSNSQEVKPGSIFFCIKGTRLDGHEFAQDALEKGAVAIVAERKVETTTGAPLILVKNSRMAYALASAAFFGFPSRFLKLVGVTGTNGKTTTTFMLESIFKKAGYRTGLIGTVTNRINDKDLPVRHTTPDPFELQDLFKAMQNAGVEVAVMEVSSHAIDQRRIAGTYFDVLAFTNLSQDHLDYHGSLEEYARVKGSLFLENPQLPWVVNADDFFGERLIKQGKKIGAEILTYGLSKKAMVRAENIELNVDSIKFDLRFNNDFLGRVSLPIAGKFNVYNAMAAFCVTTLLGIDFDSYLNGLASFKGVPGRFEVIKAPESFIIVVDYAHTPDGLEKVLDSSIELLKDKGRIITVFGCGGDRDKDKRPKMGRIAAEKSNFVIVTSDNPRSEDPQKIIEDILAGIPEEFMPKVKVEVDRKKAIYMAVELARSGDIVLIAGKGHETYQIFKDKVVPFDDREVAREALSERMKKVAF